MIAPHARFTFTLERAPSSSRNGLFWGNISVINSAVAGSLVTHTQAPTHLPTHNNNRHNNKIHLTQTKCYLWLFGENPPLASIGTSSLGSRTLRRPPAAAAERACTPRISRRGKAAYANVPPCPAGSTSQLKLSNVSNLAFYAQSTMTVISGRVK